MTAALIILFLIMFFVMLWLRWHVRQQYKHDTVLVSFRALRDDAMLLLADKSMLHSSSAGMKECIAIRQIIHQLDNLIVHFDRSKKDFSSLEVFDKMISVSLRNLSHNIRKPREKESEELNHLRAAMGLVMLQAFVTLIPFFRFRTTTRIAGVFVNILVLIGIRRMKKTQSVFRVHQRLENFRSGHETIAA